MNFLKINIKHFMVLYLTVLLVWGSLALGNPEIVWKGILLVLIYATLDLLWTYFRDSLWYLPESSVISGLILALVGAPAPGLTLLFFLPLAAVFSKQIIKIKGRHIFNPAVFAIVLLSVAGFPALSWWGPSVNTAIAGLTLAAGIFILFRQNRFETALAFIFPYAILSVALEFWGSRDLSSAFASVLPQLSSGAFIFLVTVMLIEPLTSNFPTTKERAAYGLIAAIAAILIILYNNNYILGLDPLLVGILFGNLTMSLVALRNYK